METKATFENRLVADFIVEYLHSLDCDTARMGFNPKKYYANVIDNNNSFVSNYCKPQLNYINYLIKQYHPKELCRLGDMHNGKCTVLLKEEEIKFIYKPTKPDLLILLEKVLSLLNEDNVFDFTFINIGDRDKDGFCVDFIEEEQIEDYGKFSFHYGALILCLTLLRGVDFHKDNILSIQSTPVVVDCESLFYPNIKDTKEYSVEATLLLPTKYNPRSMLDHFPLDIKRISDGVMTATETIRRKLARIKDIVMDAYATSARLIFKPTHYYHSVLKNSLHPKYLDDYEARHQYIKDCLVGEHVISKTIIQYELEDLLHLNIPYFSYAEERLYNSNGAEIPQSFLSPSLPKIIPTLDGVGLLANKILEKLGNEK